MRDLVFKNITSFNKKRRRLALWEEIEQQGVKTIVKRHFIYRAEKISGKTEGKQSLPMVFIVKEKNTRELKERFYCKIKGQLVVEREGSLYIINYIHSLQICVKALKKEILT